MYYEESVAVTEKDRKKIFVRIIVALALTYFLSGAYTALALPFAGIARLCFIGITVSAVYYAFRHGLIEYKYKIEDGVLIFITNSGKYDKVLVEVDAERVVCIQKGAVKDKNALNAAKTSGERTRYTMECTDEKGKHIYLIFEPSETYLAKAAELGIVIE